MFLSGSLFLTLNYLYLATSTWVEMCCYNWPYLQLTVKLMKSMDFCNVSLLSSAHCQSVSVWNWNLALIYSEPYFSNKKHLFCLVWWPWDSWRGEKHFESWKNPSYIKMEEVFFLLKQQNHTQRIRKKVQEKWLQCKLSNQFSVPFIYWMKSEHS